MTLPTLSVTDRHALKALTLEQSQVLPAGTVWLCQGKTIARTIPLQHIPFPLPKGVNTLCVAVSDYPAVAEWLK